MRKLFLVFFSVFFFLLGLVWALLVHSAHAADFPLPKKPVAGMYTPLPKVKPCMAEFCEVVDPKTLKCLHRCALK